VTRPGPLDRHRRIGAGEGLSRLQALIKGILRNEDIEPKTVRSRKHYAQTVSLPSWALLTGEPFIGTQPARSQAKILSVWPQSSPGSWPRRSRDDARLRFCASAGAFLAKKPLAICPCLFLRGDVCDDHGGTRAFYRPSMDSIQLPPREAFVGTRASSPAESYYSTLLA
jgi:hypothetical protein